MLSFFLLLSQVDRAQPARAVIEAAYQRSASAAAYKFYPSMVAYRASNFEAFAPQGQPMDLSEEEARYKILFQSVLSVKLSFSIEEFEQKDSSHCRCLLLQTMVVTRPQPEHQGPLTVQLRTLSQDDWERSCVGWRLRRRHLQQQAYEDPPL